MTAPDTIDLETDPRFPSGPWTGFFLQPLLPGRHLMELGLRFSNGVITGAGRDWAGQFFVRGRSDLPDGKCHWTRSSGATQAWFYPRSHQRTRPDRLP